MTTAQLRPRAETDLSERTRYYRRQAGAPVGVRFFEAAIVALRRIERRPHAGSPRIGELGGVTDLRVLRIAGCPCGWCSFVAGDDVDVVRLVAFAQDLATILSDLDPE